MSKLRSGANERDVLPTDSPFAIAPGRVVTTARILRRARADGAVDADAAGAVDAVASSGGFALPADLRDRFETSLGADLSGVRLHDGDASAAAASAVGARAFAVGQDIHFGAGEYDPSGRDGVFLIAHEVAHTQQQQGGAPHRQDKLEVSSPGDGAELEADRAASAMLDGQPANVSAAAPALARKEATVTVGKIEAVGAMAPARRVEVVQNLVTHTQELVGDAITYCGDKLQATFGLQQDIVSNHVKAYEKQLEEIEKQYNEGAEIANEAKEKAEALEKNKQGAETALKLGLAVLDVLVEESVHCAPVAAGVVLVVDLAASSWIAGKTKPPEITIPTLGPLPKLTFLDKDLAASTQIANAFHAVTNLGGTVKQLAGASAKLSALHEALKGGSPSSDQVGQLARLDEVMADCGAIQKTVDQMRFQADLAFERTRHAWAFDGVGPVKSFRELRAESLVGTYVPIVEIVSDTPASVQVTVSGAKDTFNAYLRGCYFTDQWGQVTKVKTPKVGDSHRVQYNKGDTLYLIIDT